MIQHTQYQSVKSRFWLFILMWCVCFFGLTCATKNMIDIGFLVHNVYGTFALGMAWFGLGALCVLLDNYRRTICTVCEKDKAPKRSSDFWNSILDFTGRASRREFWWGLLLYGIIIWGLVALILVFLHNGMLALVACLTFLIPLWALFVRRLHDSGHSGWWALIPSMGAAMLIVSWFVVIFWQISWFFADIGMDLWGVLIYLLSALFIGLMPGRRSVSKRNNT